MDNVKEEKGIQNIINIYSLNGNIKQLWDYFSSDINNDNLNEKIILFIKDKLSEQINIELTQDIVDYIIDKGSNSIIDRIFNQEFFELFINKTIENKSENNLIEEKSLFLIQKWVKKFSGKYQILIEIYNKYKKDGKSFPEIINTYNKYTNINENNNDNLKEKTDIISNNDEKY